MPKIQALDIHYLHSIITITCIYLEKTPIFILRFGSTKKQANKLKNLMLIC